MSIALRAALMNMTAVVERGVRLQEAGEDTPDAVVAQFARDMSAALIVAKAALATSDESDAGHGAEERSAWDRYAAAAAGGCMMIDGYASLEAAESAVTVADQLLAARRERFPRRSTS